MLQLVVVIGLGSVFADSQTVFLVMKLLGGGYLIVLRKMHGAFAAATSSLSRSLPPPFRAGRYARRSARVSLSAPPIRRGWSSSTAVLPTFIDRAQGNATLQLATLGVICGLVAAVSDSTWALASGTARSWLGRSPKRLELLSAGGGVTMIALGAALVVTGRRR